MSNWVWGLGVPAICAVSAPATLGGSAWLLAALYGALAARIGSSPRARALSPRDARLYTVFTTIAKVPQALGQARYTLAKWRGMRTQLIEYKHTEGRTDESAPSRLVPR